MNFDDHLASLRVHAEAGFERELLDATYRSFACNDTDLRLCYFAVSFREWLRHLLARRSPDAEVRACKWWAPSSQRGDQLTRRDRLRFAVAGGLDLDSLEIEFGLDFSDRIGEVLAITNRLSQWTHVGPKSWGLSANEVRQSASEVGRVVLSYLAAIEELREEVVQGLEGYFDRSLFERLIEEEWPELLEVSTHHEIDSVQIDDVSVTGIDSKWVMFEGSGEVTASLGYGRGEDGVELSHSFGCRASFCAPLDGIRSDGLRALDVQIDTESWYGYEDD
ncbi:MAG: hypothetical protein AAFY15_07660 [Cyanobacteria bacterium J06648_11]